MNCSEIFFGVSLLHSPGSHCFCYYLVAGVGKSFQDASNVSRIGVKIGYIGKMLILCPSIMCACRKVTMSVCVCLRIWVEGQIIFYVTLENLACVHVT